MSLLVALIRRFVECTGGSSLILVSFMTGVALTEGLGLLLVIPLLVLAGTASAPGESGALVEALEAVAAFAKISFSLESVLVVFVLLIILRQFIVFLEAKLTARTRVEFVASVREEIFTELEKTSWLYLSGKRLEKMGQLLLVDSWRIGEAALHVVRLFSSLLLLLVNFLVATLLSPLLAVALLGSIVLMGTLFGNRLQSVREQGTDVSKIHTSYYGVVENYLDNIRTAKMAGAGDRARRELLATIDSLNDRLAGFVHDFEFVKFALQMSGAIVIALSLLFAVNVLKLDAPLLLLLVLITARFIPRVSLINQYLHRLIHDLPAFGYSISVLNECRAHPDPALDRSPIAAPRRSIGVSGIVVAYGDSSTEPVLNGYSLEFPVGEMVAITGPSGAGKSTLADVISGLLEPTAGSILVDGVAVPADRIGGWRAQVGYVPQSAALLQDTVERNLTWVRQSPPSELEIREALDCAELSDVIRGLKHGMKTTVGRREGRLSGGERQRLAIARELLRRPNLLVLDEATNALDAATELRVLRNLRERYPGLSILIVAHRDTVTAVADRVIVLDKRIDAERN
ncbi:MAG: ABC transporter ATP-binding protein/permease [Gammaproteobacteria bacterium]|nr:ABC transporter ATP-binding protein/permease [Gammaproteobacteria bacterium]